MTAEVPRPVEINTLFWPVGAREFARAHCVVNDDQLTRIRQAVQQSGGATLVKATLEMDDATSKITTDLWMLPAWPLQQVGDGANLWLLNLVDDRYWWW